MAPEGRQAGSGLVKAPPQTVGLNLVSVVVVWMEFVRELRFHWEHCIPIGRVTSHCGE